MSLLLSPTSISVHIEAAHLVTAPQRSARFSIYALNARVSFIFVALETTSIRMHLKEVCTIVFFTSLQYYEYIYHSQGAIVLAKDPTNDRSPQEKPKLTTINNIPFTVWETHQP